MESLRTWADKRERITVYPSATLLEFGSPEDLNEALSRGINGMRMSDLLLIVPGELPIEMLKHFRVSGNRDWAAPPEKCVEVAEDGVTLAVDLARSDLLLETQMQRFAEPVDGVTVQGHRRYRMTPGSLEQARKTGLDVKDLDEWFVQRTGLSLSPAGRLLLQGSASSQVKMRQRLVLDVGAEKIADGLLQWPQTRGLIEERLGATTLAVAQDQWAALRKHSRAGDSGGGGLRTWRDWQLARLTRSQRRRRTGHLSGRPVLARAVKCSVRRREVRRRRWLRVKR